MLRERYNGGLAWIVWELHELLASYLPIRSWDES